MKTGDLVKMKNSFWKNTTWAKNGDTNPPAVVLSAYGNAVKVIFPDGTRKATFSKYWYVISKRK